MKTSPSKVLELLGSELLETLYIGTDNLPSDPPAKVRECRTSPQGSVESCDGASARLYSNLRQILDRLKSHCEESYEQLCDLIGGLEVGGSTLDVETRNYINGRDRKDHTTEDDTSGEVVDRSLKGSVDVLLIPLLRLLVRTGRFASTSCCSGRIVLFESNPDHATMATKRSKVFGRAGRFLYSSHCHIDDAEFEEVVRALNMPVKCKHDCYHGDGDDTPVTDTAGDSTPGDVSQHVVLLKFEPFVLHVECESMQDAIELLQICRTSGLKQSGIISCSKRVIVSICGKTTLEAPVAIRHYHRTEVVGEEEEDQAKLDAGGRLISVKWLVNEEYLQYLIMTCNKKLSATFHQMLKLYWACVHKMGIDPRKPFSMP